MYSISSGNQFVSFEHAYPNQRIQHSDISLIHGLKKWNFLNIFKFICLLNFVIQFSETCERTNHQDSLIVQP